jgi:hypothetical protein
MLDIGDNLDILDILDMGGIFVTHHSSSVIVVFCRFLLFSMSVDQNFEEMTGAKRHTHNSNGNDENLTPANNANSSTIRVRGF